MADNYANYIVKNTVPKSMTLDDIKTATIADPTLTKVFKSIKSGQWDEKDGELKSYRLCADELPTTEESNVILKGSRIVIPDKLQDHFTPLAHVGHQGIRQ